MSALCRSCGAPIIWAVGEATGKGNPLDAEPVENGTLQAVGNRADGRMMVRYLRKDEVANPNLLRYVSHFSTCPNADSHRTAPRRKRRRTRRFSQ